jgi:hypothetical protein
VIDNFSGNGSLSGSDQIDLKGINFNSVHDSYSNGILTVTDGSNTTTLDFNGTYVLANFKFASDGGGGTIVYDPPVPSPGGSPISGNNAASLFAGAGQDSFVFASDSGSENFEPTANNVPFNHTSFTNSQAGLIGPHERTHGPASVADSAHDAMPGEPLTAAHVHTHLGDFHIV